MASSMMAECLMPGEHVAEASDRTRITGLESGRSIIRSTWKRIGDSPGLLDCHLGLLYIP